MLRALPLCSRLVLIQMLWIIADKMPFSWLHSQDVAGWV